jgi:hypothetical protein
MARIPDHEIERLKKEISVERLRIVCPSTMNRPFFVFPQMC